MTRGGLAAALVCAWAATAAAQTITAEQAERVPTDRTLPALVGEAAGVVAVDGDGNPQIRGGTLTMNRMFVDGFEVTDAITGGFGARLPFAALAAVTVRTRATDAEAAALGGVVDVETLGGGDRLHLDASVWAGGAALAAGPLDAGVRARPVAMLPPMPTFDWQASLAAGGPLVRGRLWYALAVEYDRAGDADAALAHLRLTWAPGARDVVTLSANADPLVRGDGSVEGGAFAVARWEHAAGARATTRAQAGFQYEALPGDTRLVARFDPSLTLRGRLGGTHEARIGLQSLLAVRDVDVAGGRAFVAADGSYRRIDRDAWALRQWGGGVGLYVQDRWRPWPRLTVSPGLRFDWGAARNSVGETVASLWGLGPRIGAAYDATGDGKTVVSFSYGRASETLPMLAAANADARGVVATYQWDPAAQRFLPLGASGGRDGYRLDPHATAPHADEVTLGLGRALGALWAHVDYTYKRIANVWDGVEVNQIWNPAGSDVVGFVDGRAHAVFQYTTPDANWRAYHGLDFVVETRAWSRLDLYAAYTVSWLYGPGAEELGQVGGAEAGWSPFYNPRQTMFYDGFLPEDVRHVVKLRASYDWRGLSLGTWLRYQSGAPAARRYYNAFDGDFTTRRGPQDELRLPDTLEVDLRVAYDVHAWLGASHLTLVADLFDLFGLDGVVAIDTRDLPSYGAVLRRQEPFRLQLGLRYTY